MPHAIQHGSFRLEARIQEGYIQVIRRQGHRSRWPVLGLGTWNGVPMRSSLTHIILVLGAPRVNGRCLQLVLLSRHTKDKGYSVRKPRDLDTGCDEPLVHTATPPFIPWPRTCSGTRCAELYTSLDEDSSISLWRGTLAVMGGQVLLGGTEETDQVCFTAMWSHACVNGRLEKQHWLGMYCSMNRRRSWRSWRQLEKSSKRWSRSLKNCLIPLSTSCFLPTSRYQNQQIQRTKSPTPSGKVVWDAILLSGVAKSLRITGQKS